MYNIQATRLYKAIFGEQSTLFIEVRTYKGKHESRYYGHSETTFRGFTECGGGAPGVYLGCAGHWEISAGAAIRGPAGAAVCVAARQPAGARGFDRRAANYRRHKPLLPAASDCPRGAILSFPRRAECLLARGAEGLL